MNQENSNETSAPWLKLCLCLGLAIFFAWCLDLLPRPVREKAPVTKCKNNLKQLGLIIQSYYSDTKISTWPSLNSVEVSATNDGGLGFDAQFLSCPAERHHHSMHYVWNPKISGGTWAEWSTPHSPLIWDASPHKFNDKINVLFGDGHVEDLTPERLKELTE